ncbi:TetR/AcrR family transcriptional regulator [Mucilaginibacter calamicampi]|uniref:TetR/AcrR family transcriptional regulator n=1 Tax=Mucilaginibacter calamicampi TaxID=1302352 RepID=A0ABW2YTK5_9SPHI
MTKAEKTRQFIIEKAAPIFNTKGMAGTSMSDIMEATKLAKGSMYVHFENKEDLCNAVVDYNLDSLSKKISAAVNKQKTAKGKLFAYFDFLSDPLNPPVHGGCPMLNFGMEADDTNPVIAQKVNKVLQISIKGVESVIQQGIADEEFKADWNASEFGVKSIAMIQGGTLMSRVSGSNAQLQVIIELLKREIEEHIK